MKIMICGGKGQLGSDCTQVLNKTHALLSIDLDELDITNYSEFKKVAQRFNPDCIVNCAAYTAVDACETKRELAWMANVKGPENLARYVEKYGGQLIHISTDYVFDGKKTVPDAYTEKDETNPLSYYGVTKLEGEKVVRQFSNRHIILRIAWLYGVKGNNFLKTMLRLALQDPRRKITIVNDQYGSPTWSFRVALQIQNLIEADGNGTYHATSESYCTWYELAKYLLEKMDIPNAFIPCTTEQYPTPAPRPMNSILENRRLKDEGHNLMIPWQSDVDQFVSTFKDRLIKEVREMK
jgi:dTDP-4-dehydrorhamnose reductase